MTPAPHDPTGQGASGDPYRSFALSAYKAGSRDAFGAPYGMPRRELPPITDADYIQHGRDQYASGYNTGAVDVLKIVVSVFFLSLIGGIIVFWLLTR